MVENHNVGELDENKCATDVAEKAPTVAGNAPDDNKNISTPDNSNAEEPSNTESALAIHIEAPERQVPTFIELEVENRKQMVCYKEGTAYKYAECSYVLSNEELSTSLLFGQNKDGIVKIIGQDKNGEKLLVLEIPEKDESDIGILEFICLPLDPFLSFIDDGKLTIVMNHPCSCPECAGKRKVEINDGVAQGSGNIVIWKIDLEDENGPCLEQVMYTEGSIDGYVMSLIACVENGKPGILVFNSDEEPVQLKPTRFSELLPFTALGANDEIEIDGIPSGVSVFDFEKGTFEIVGKDGNKKWGIEKIIIEENTDTEEPQDSSEEKNTATITIEGNNSPIQCASAANKNV